MKKKNKKKEESAFYKMLAFAYRAMSVLKMFLDICFHSDSKKLMMFKIHLGKDASVFEQCK